MELLEAIKSDTGNNAGIFASLKVAASLPGKLDELMEHLKANPSLKVADIIPEFQKMLAPGKETMAKKPFNLGQRIFDAITFEHFKKKE